MMKLSGILAITGLMAISGAAVAAPLTNVPGSAGVQGTSLIEKAHGEHRSCDEGRGGWHRHNRYGDRVDCDRPYSGRPQHHPGYAPPPPYVKHLPPPPPVYHHRPASPRHCVKDWHCEKSGPFDLKKKCYWRDLCN